jgi:hypothetical protein
MTHLKRILVPTDFGRTSDLALHCAFDVAKAFARRFTFFRSSKRRVTLWRMRISSDSPPCSSSWSVRPSDDLPSCYCDIRMAT